MSKLEARKSSTLPANSSIDSNQLLSLCHRIRESMETLEQSVRLTQLRLITLSYISRASRSGSSSASWWRCFDNFIELCNLSQVVVQLLNELHQKLSDSSENSIHYQIASQQLMFFTSEWYDNIAPKLNATFEMANKQELDESNDQRRPRRQVRKGSNSQEAGDMQVRDALMRLKQSMEENERLIATIATNINYTRTTIENIYDSLQSTKLELDAGERNAVESVGLIRSANKCKMVLVLVLALIMALISYYVLRYIYSLLVS